MYGEYASFSDLKGQIFATVQQHGESIEFTKANGDRYVLEHLQDCCESVYVESIVGDLSDLENSEILRAEEASENDPNASESGTWTFFKLASRKGYVDIRFYGESNGYYCESADLYFYPVNQED